MINDLNKHEIMLSVPFVNSSEYIDFLSELADKQPPDGNKIYEVYGSLPQDLVGNLRPPDSVPPMTLAQLEDNIAKLHKHGIKFNYVMNSELLPIPLSEEYIYRIIKLLKKLSDIGIDEVTATLPLIISIIKRYFPNLKINASICAEISTVREAVEFEELGADVLVLDRDINRDFPLLRKIRSRFSGGMKVLCNSACVFHCINVHYHSTYSSALTNSSLMGLETGKSVFGIPHCNFYCRRRFFSDPAELIKLHWIRPEDMPVYAAEGITMFKIDGRDKEPEYLKTIITAYLNGHYDGNLLHLLQPEFCPDISLITPSEEPRSGNKNDPAVLDKQTEAFLAEAEEWRVGIDNRDLDGFIDALASGKVVCSGDCGICGYCGKYADKIHIDPVWQKKW
ncbi:MAG: U32 family peptidase [Oscillospiraceae bacterium]|nr:U32 family peptidase [Oscillospiraceae bacterium]